MKNVIENNKTRKNVEEIISEVPMGMRRYSVTIHNKYGSISGWPDLDYDDVIKILHKHSDNILLWCVHTKRTPRTFSIEISLD